MEIAENNPEQTTEPTTQTITKPQPTPLRTCATCGKQNLELNRCSRCKAAYYCDVDCQKKDYPEHKKTCTPASGETSNQPKSSSEIPKAQTESKPTVVAATGIEQFKDLQHVGSGNFSQIFRGISKKDNQVYAIKQIEKAKLKRLEKENDVFMEKHCLTKLKGWDYAVQIHKTFQDEISLYIAMEYPERGELWNQCRTYGFVSEKLVKHFFTQIAFAISEMHERFDIVHRDLKPENILLTEDRRIKLIDFGTAKDISRPDIKGSGNGLRRRRVFEHFIGTPNYMPPECIHNKASEKVSDVYALAGVFYFLKTGNPPFTGGSEYLIFTKSTKNQVYLPDEIFSKTEQDLILKMMEKDYKNRITMKDVLAHEYFKDVDFSKTLSTYEQAVAKISREDQLLIKLKEQLMSKTDKHIEELEQRVKVFEEIKELLNKALEEWSGLEGVDLKYLQDKLQLFKICSYNTLNVVNDTGSGFEEIHKRFREDSNF